MSMFNLNPVELLTFFAVLVRYATVVAMLPFLGDRFVPGPAKILLALSATICIHPALVARGLVHPGEAIAWGATPGGILGTVAFETGVGLVLGFVARMSFQAVSFGGNLVGNFMGFAIASTFDPQEQSQTQIVAEIQMAIAMLIFLVLDGHHLMIRASLDSYRSIGLGGSGISGGAMAAFNPTFAARLIELTAQVIKFGIQIAAPVAVTLFAVNIVFGVMSKAMPQINVLVLSATISAVIGLIVMFLCLGEFQAAVGEHFSHIGEWMTTVMQGMAVGR